MITRTNIYVPIIILVLIFVFANTETAQAKLGDQVLKEGMKNQEVMQLQNHLQLFGYDTNGIDGNYGKQTKEAVRLFQAKNGLTADGIAGSSTINAILAIINKDSYTQPSRSKGVTRSGLTLTTHEMNCLARVVFGEARGENFEGQVAVAAVVLNRYYNGEFGNSIEKIITQPGAFTAVSDGQYYLKPNQNAYEAAKQAIQGWDPTNGAIYYWNPDTATSKWVWNRPIIKIIGRHVFAR